MNGHYPLADESYEQEYAKIKDQFSKKLVKFNEKPNEALITDLRRDYDDAQSTVRYTQITLLLHLMFQKLLAIEQEISSYPQEFRTQQRAKLKKMREEMEKMRKQVVEAEQSLREMSDLIGSSVGDREDSSHEGKGLKQLSNQNQKLQDAKRAAYDIEGQSNQIGFEVARQNDQLTGMIKQNKDITNELGIAGQLLERIRKNIVKKKAIMCGVISFLVLCLIVIISSYF